MPAEPRNFMPSRASVGSAKQGSIFDPGVNRIRVGKRRLDVPHPLEFPRVLRAVVPLMSRQWRAGFCRSVIDELVALTLRPTLWAFQILGLTTGREPSFTAVVGPLDDLAEPTAALRDIEP